MSLVNVELQQGLTLQREGRFEEAERVYQSAVRADPNNSMAWNLLGTVAFERNNLQGSAACFAKALEIQPALSESHNNLGLVLLRLGLPEEALRGCFQMD